VVSPNYSAVPGIGDIRLSGSQKRSQYSVRYWRWQHGALYLPLHGQLRQHFCSPRLAITPPNPG
jgi:hypothetical protein